MSLLERIVIDPDVVHGRPAVRGTRMRVADVLSLLAAGAGEEEILEDYPYLTSEETSDRAMRINELKAFLVTSEDSLQHPE